jgi:hypothetical protein
MATRLTQTNKREAKLLPEWIVALDCRYLTNGILQCFECFDTLPSVGAKAGGAKGLFDATEFVAALQRERTE